MKKFHFIYKTTNLVNGLIYVGQHSTDNLDDDYLGSGVYRSPDYKIYKDNNFKREILELCTIDEIDDREKFWIVKLNATNPLIGYNKRVTSCKSKSGRVLSKETILKMSRPRFDIMGEKNFWFGKDRKGKNNPHYGHKHSEESINKIKINHADVSKERNPNWKKNASEDTKKKMSESITNREPLKCPHCNIKSRVYSNMTRWHFDNCKHNSNNLSNLKKMIVWR